MIIIQAIGHVWVEIVKAWIRGLESVKLFYDVDGVRESLTGVDLIALPPLIHVLVEIKSILGFELVTCDPFIQMEIIFGQEVLQHLLLYLLIVDDH